MAKVRLGGVVAALVLALGVFAGSALAIVNGSPDGNDHPYVGAAFDPVTHALCSGSLLQPDVFVTAAHCFASGTVVLVTVNPDAAAGFESGQLVPGIVTDDPHFALRPTGGLAGSDLNDVAVVQLFGPIDVSRYASLPPRVGYDDSLPNNQRIVNVGYGAPAVGFRTEAGAKIIPGGGATGADFLKISSSAGQGGATCFGDSGGPNLVGDMIVAINSYGASATCNAVSYSQRLDTPEAYGFVSSFLH